MLLLLLLKLPENWGEKVMADGRVYYYNMVTNETTWKKPDRSSYRKPGGSEKKSLEEELELQLIFPIPDVCPLDQFPAIPFFSPLSLSHSRSLFFFSSLSLFLENWSLQGGVDLCLWWTSWKHL